MTVEIRQHAPGKDTRDFIQAGVEVSSAAIGRGSRRST